ncbi:DUF3300 domain-containing protein [Paraburkholderia sp. BCC1884]|uniref:DUF3300 domain-containing protein n=1 Tax=Paraburkholderia sp. BCC1884 TaxID=2562668 RepID=UPI00118280B3|nr:DUF3300 domain-containing protein [Paraburkholderia sp. BCC1884]
MTRVAAIAGRIAASVFTTSLRSVAILALTAASYGGAQSFAQTPPPAPAPANAAPAAPKLDAQQLDALTAPIAAYPDALLAQVLMATTFPDDVAAAAAWSKDHPQVKGDDAVKAVSSMPWDPSVQSLVAFPQALATMAQNPNWVDAIGQAFLAQSSDVMDSVQRLRQAAYKAGNLKTSEQQKVEVQPANNTIVIQPANPQVVYVPTYNPTTFYGPWPYAAYPPTYLPPPPGYAIGTALATGLAFGAGIAITNSLWGGCDWGRHDVNVNVNRYNNINVNHRIDANRSTSNWDRSNAINNRSRMQANGNRPGGINGRPGGPGGGADRSAYRGRDNAQRDQARQTLSQRTGQNMSGSANDRVNNIRQGGGAKPGAGGNRGAGARAGGGAAGANRAEVGNRAQGLNRDNALRDAGNGNASRQSIQRGQQSRAEAGSRGSGAMSNARQNNAGGARAAAANHSGGGRAAGGGGGMGGGGGRGGGLGGGGGGRGGGGGGGHRRH